MPAAKKRLTILALVAIGAAFYVLNVLTPLCADDYSYTFTFAKTYDKIRITNLVELFWSQVNHYMIMNGRTVAHTLAQLFLMWGKPVFNAINTAAFLLLGWAMQALMTGRRQFRLPLFLFSLVMVWFFTPAFGQDFLWLTGSCTYLYCVLLILLYLIGFRRALAGDSRGGWARAVLFFPFGVLAGWSLENGAAAMIAMEVCFLIALRLDRAPLRAWMFTGLAGTLTGFALLLLAPGQSARLENSGGMGTLGAWVGRGWQITVQAAKYLWVPALLFLALVAWRMKADGWRGFWGRWRQWLATAVFLLGSLASAYSMVVTPQFPARTWSCIVIFTVVTVGSAAALCPDLKIPRPAAAGACCLVLAAVAVTYAGAFSSIHTTYTQVAQRTAYIRQVQAEGGTEVTVEPIRADCKYNCYKPEGDLNLDSGIWPNTAIALYYGLEEVHSTQEQREGDTNG